MTVAPPDRGFDLPPGIEIARPVRAEVSIAAPAAKVWDRLSEPGHLKRCHPFCAATEVEQWPGVGSRDSITYYSGRRYERNFVGWIDGVGYDVELGDPPNQTSRVLWRVHPVDDGRCDMSIEVLPYVRASLPPEKKARYQSRLFGADLQHYLECVVKGVAWWVETGTDVQEDQFGRDPLYSA